MALEFPRSFPSWVYGPQNVARLITSPNEFSALDPSQWADSPADWLDVQVPEAFKNNEQADPVVADAFVAEEPPEPTKADYLASVVVDDPLVEFMQTEPLEEQSETVTTVTPPPAAPVVIEMPVKRGPGRPRKVQA